MCKFVFTAEFKMHTLLHTEEDYNLESLMSVIMSRNIHSLSLVLSVHYITMMEKQRIDLINIVHNL